MSSFKQLRNGDMIFLHYKTLDKTLVITIEDIIQIGNRMLFIKDNIGYPLELQMSDINNSKAECNMYMAATTLEDFYALLAQQDEDIDHVLRYLYKWEREQEEGQCI